LINLPKNSNKTQICSQTAPKHTNLLTNNTDSALDLLKIIKSAVESSKSTNLNKIQTGITALYCVCIELSCLAAQITDPYCIHTAVQSLAA
jgi:hypothetical protein